MSPAIRTAGAIALVAGIGILDALVSARLPFSILYFAPVIGATWYIGRSQGLVVAVVAIAARFITDIHWNGIDAFSLLQALKASMRSRSCRRCSGAPRSSSRRG